MEWQGDQGLRWRALKPFGIEIDHDFSKPLCPAAAARFVALVRDHSLIVAHRQVLGRVQHNALLELLGKIVPHRDGEAGYIQSDAASGVIGSELTFHADAAYTETPFEVLSLHAVDVVDGASSTLFVDAQDALDELAPRLRAQLVAHDANMMSGAIDQLGARLCDLPEKNLPTSRRTLPAIRTNPRTRRNYISVSAMHTSDLVGMPRADSTALLTEIFDAMYASDRVHEHVWRNGDLVIWDNIACQHARGSLHHAGRRILQRVIVGQHAHATPHVKAG